MGGGVTPAYLASERSERSLDTTMHITASERSERSLDTMNTKRIVLAQLINQDYPPNNDDLNNYGTHREGHSPLRARTTWTA